MFYKSFFKLGLVLSVAFFMYGCATAPKRPDWIAKGAGAFRGERKALYGVGLAEGITSEALRRTTADNRAIAEVSRQLTVMSTSLARDYMSSASAVESERQAGEQYVESTVKTFTSNTLSGVKIIDRWDDGNVTYALATLNLDDLKSMTANIKQLSQQAREYIKENAEEAFDRLEAEQEKRGR